MSGDIDIEEHDLMENPRIRTIFPDLTLLKKEILDADHEALRQTLKSDTSKRKGSLPHEKQSITNDIMITYIKEELKTEDNLIRLNKAKSGTVEKFKNATLSSNVFVFGSKPKSITNDKQLQCDVKICLKDIKHYLKKSSRYCLICKTLFPKSCFLEDHKIKYHKDTLNKNVDKTSHSFRDGDTNINEGNPTNKCFHCRETFLTQELLIEHLYNVLDKKRSNTRKYILDKEMKSKDVQNLQQVSAVADTFEESTTKARSGTNSVNANCYDTISVDSRDSNAMSTEKESSVLDNEIQAYCDASSNNVFQCSICSYYFLQEKFYKVHMLKKHSTQVKQMNMIKFNPKCSFCSCMCPGIKQYNKHLHNAHASIISNKNVIKVFKHNIQSNKKNTIQEDKDIESMATQKGNATPLNLESSYDLINESLLIFISVLFKCLKCDIHFLSPRLAASHIIHNEILINWKCSLCKVFFKRSDEDLHMKQHKYNKSFKIVKLDFTDLDRILIKCTKCPLHVPENEYRHHTNVCKDTVVSWHCPVCDINIDGNVSNKRTHNSYHTDRGNTASDFIIINDSLMNPEIQKNNVDDLDSEDTRSNSVKSLDADDGDYSSYESDDYLPIQDLVSNKNNRNRSEGKSMGRDDSIITNHKSTVKYKAKTQKRSLVSDKVNAKDDSLKTQKENVKSKKRKRPSKLMQSCKMIREEVDVKCSINHGYYYLKFNYAGLGHPKHLLNLSYCNSCKCFVNFYNRLDLHLRSHPEAHTRWACDICGLVLMPKMRSRHEKFHTMNPSLKLQDFNFYDFITGKQILPPMPFYPECGSCHTHLLSKGEMHRHLCSECPRLHCDICEKMFSESTYNLHISFHAYYLKSRSPVEHSDSNKKVLGHAVSEKNDNDSSSVGTVGIEPREGENKPEEDGNSANKNNDDVMDVDDYNFEEEKVDMNHEPLPDTEDSQGTNTKDEVNVNAVREYLYTCKSCFLTVTSYDQLVEHCQSHYNNRYRSIITEECMQCNLIFDRLSIRSHIKLHNSCIAKSNIEVLVCELFHFGRGNLEWSNEVFKSVTETERERIIKNSIYKDECRVKLDIAQKGDPELTLYQCTKCDIFLEGPDIYNHRQKCTGKNKKYPCFECGIALLSTSHRTQHLKVHDRPGVSAKAYRIVVFNRPADKLLNDLICSTTSQYVLYTCRSCRGVEHWRALKSHQCKVDDLKKCTHCALLISDKDIDKHEARHKTTDTFVASNMKVVMFGQASPGSTERHKENSFTGVIFDYTFYECVKCGICVKQLELSTRHSCVTDAAKCKCAKCNLYFEDSNMKRHRAMHTSDPEFMQDALCVIPFDPEETYERLERESQSQVKNMDKDVIIQEKTDVLYRCSCSLHYLTEADAREHVKRKRCSAIFKRKLKQTCSKCNLNFTPDILYKHLLQHHADKYVKYSFDVVDVGEELKQSSDTANIDSTS